MGRERLQFSFTETTIANATTEINAYIDAVYNAVGASQDKETVDVTVKVYHYTGAVYRTSTFSMYAESVTATINTVLKAQVSAFMTGITNVIAASGLTTVSSCYGTGIAVVEY